jgi:hypothetical protein
VCDRRWSDGAEEDENGHHQQRWEHANREEVAGADRQRQAQAQRDETEVEEQAQLLAHGEVDDDHRERDRETESDHLPSRLVALLPEGPRVAHEFTVGKSSRPVRTARRIEVSGLVEVGWWIESRRSVQGRVDPPGCRIDLAGSRKLVVGDTELGELPGTHQHAALQ